METNKPYFAPLWGAKFDNGVTYELELFKQTLAAVTANPTICGYNSAGVVDVALEITGTALKRLQETNGSLAQYASTDPVVRPPELPSGQDS